MKKVVTIIGARPQFIKASAVSRAFHEVGDIVEVIVHTGQHFDANMSDIFFDELCLPVPQYNLGVGGGTSTENIGRMIEQIEKVLLIEQPQHVLVYGDTDSTLAGALVARKLNISLVHVEAGLRSQNMTMPEEVNRIITDRISDILFCPTKLSVENLQKEGFDKFPVNIEMVGDVMFDTCRHFSKSARKPASVANSSGNFDYSLITIHRAENTDSKENLVGIFTAIEQLALDSKFIMPLHPRTVKSLDKHGIKISNRNIILIDPVGYLEMLWLIKNCEVVLTDSGGLQKEAYFFSKPCITLRNETEWLELIQEEVNILAGVDPSNIIGAYIKQRGRQLTSVSLYGDGNSSRKIAEYLLHA